MMKEAGCAPNIYTCTVLIDGFFRNGRLDEAEVLLHSMSDVGVILNHVAYAVALKGHVKAGRLDHAFDILSIMAKDSCRPTYHIYSALLKGLLHSDKTGEADVASSMNKLDSKPLSIHAAVSESISTEDVIQSLKPVEVTDDRHSDSVFCEANISQRFRLRDEVENCSGFSSDMFNMLITGFCKEGKLVGADNWSKLCLQDSFLPKVFVAVSLNIIPNNKISVIALIPVIRLLIIVYSCSFFLNILFGDHELCTEGMAQAKRPVPDLLKQNKIDDTATFTAFLEFLLSEDDPHICQNLLQKIEQLHDTDRPVI